MLGGDGGHADNRTWPRFPPASSWPRAAAHDAGLSCGAAPLPVRWVLIRDPPGRLSPYALFCTDPGGDALVILAAYLQRWDVEVTFKEVRAHLGMETQRQWTTRAVGRATPCLLGRFSLVVLRAYALHPDHLPTRHAAWYAKSDATLVDALAAVRRQRWANRDWTSPRWQVGVANPPAQFLTLLVEAACYAA